ncbi:hypothetical protein QWJ34_10930 [Saccharibacillus sp. CPCC 101409]|uniref:hypothetical protein n=1 Tax=Saccharibacillus sp. CPCC 101409 TaxID=3058041 RepID=UPI00267341E3|nr:hypothetical protein [Saccharibacillus sp. CPCC 101409]MDO3410275.1 hypothetical protein [Saccharibacillus sp. CPCC 101409]
MKKSTRMKTAGVMAAGMIVTASLGAAAYANGGAYENFRSAALKTMEADNATVNSTIRISQNGSVTASGNVEMQTAGEESYSSGQFEVGGHKIDVEQATEDGKLILRKGDRYYSAEADADEDEHAGFGPSGKHEASPSAVRLMETASDLLLGDIKDRFTESGDTITLNLTGAQVPELANLALNAVLETGAKRGGERLSEAAQGPWAADSEWKDFDPDTLFPIAQDGRVDNVKLEAKVENGAIVSLNTTLSVSGLDKDGKSAVVEASIASTISDVGSTVPEDIDVTGKTVEELELPAGFRGAGSEESGRGFGGPFGHGPFGAGRSE